MSTEANAQGLTRAIAGWIASGLQSTPADVALAGRGMADCIAVMLAGWSDSASHALRRIDGLGDWADPLSPPARDPGTLAAHLACAAHALDFDDNAFGNHTSAVLTPVLLAEAARAPTSGPRLLDAYIAGYETWAELSAREDDSVHGKGWHPSAVYGPIAAAAALCVLRGLDADQCSNALSLAASMSGGVVAQFGTPAKPWQVGRSARAGFEAVALAQAGMTAAPDALEHPLGFLMAISPKGHVRRDGPPETGRHMARNGLNFKRYPVCYAMHRALDGLLAIQHKSMTPPEDIDRIEIEVGEAQAAMLRHAQPSSTAEAKFSLPFGAAAVLLRGGLGPAELDPNFVTSDAVRALLAKVDVHTREGRHPIEPSLAPSDSVTIHLKNGASHSSEVILPLGHFCNPAPPEVLDRKIADCLAAGPRPDHASRLLAQLRDLSALDDTRALIAIGQEDLVA